MSKDDTKYHTSDRSVLTAAEIARLDEIEARPCESDDVPETSDAAWATTVRDKQYRAMANDAIPIVLDPDVRAWLPAKGPGFQTEVNRILQERMLAEG